VKDLSVANFTIAFNDRKDEAHFINCQAFGKTAETISKYLGKGSPIFIEGRLTQQRWTTKGRKFSKVVITVDNFKFIGGKSESTSEPEKDIPF